METTPKTPIRRKRLSPEAEAEAARQIRGGRRRRRTGERLPSLRRHKASGLAVVTLSGRDVYCGTYGTAEAKARYERVVNEWLAAGKRLRNANPDGEVSVAEVGLEFWHREKGRFPEHRLFETKSALRLLRQLYGETPASEFGPLELRAIRAKWIDEGLARGTVNKRVGTIRRAFRYGVSMNLCPAAVYGGLTALENLTSRDDVRQPKKRRPVPRANIDAIRPYVCDQVWALIQLQLLTGARPGELVRLTPRDIRMTGDVWEAALEEHKTAGLDKVRVLYFGPRARAVLAPYLTGRRLDAPLFSPAEAIRTRGEAAPTHRRPNQKPTPRATDRVVRESYDVHSFRRAIRRACVAAGVEVWTPHQLRHSAATELRKEFGLEVAKCVLGHAVVGATEIYAERDLAAAKAAMARVG